MKHSLLLVLFAVLFNVLFAHPLQEVNNEDGEEDPEESGGFFQGDMVLTEEQIESLINPNRNGAKWDGYRWPNKTVFYEISSAFDDDQKAVIQRAMRELENKTCIKFEPRNETTTAYINVTADKKGCWSEVGYQNGVQTLNLQSSCFRRFGSILHEFIHALGFHHQHTASDRNDYVSIKWDNIKANHTRNFYKYESTEVTDFGVEYDYGSIMHYRRGAFSKNGKDTIVPEDPDAVIGQRDGLSAGDIKKLNAMYKCKKNV